MIVNTMSCGNHIRYEVIPTKRSLEEKLGDLMPSSLTDEEREKLEYIYDDPIQDVVDAINNANIGNIKATRI